MTATAVEQFGHADAAALVRMQFNELPFGDGDIVDEKLRLRKKGQEAVGYPQFLGSRSCVCSAAAAPAIQLGAVVLELGYQRNHIAHWYALAPEATNKRVVNVDVDD